MEHLNPISSLLHPPFGIADLKKKAKIVSVPMNFLYAKFMENYWATPSQSDMSSLYGTVTPTTPSLAPGVHGATETIHEIAFTFPDSPFLPGSDSPLLPGMDVPVSPKLSPAALFGTVASLVTKVAKGILPLIPPFIYEIINSEEKHLQNINVKITATTKKKIYQIGFGKAIGDGASIAIEVVSGEPIKFLHDKEAAKSLENFINPVFPPTTLFDRIWKRQEPHTECIITVEDPGNNLLKDAQITQFFPLSEHEGFKIVHRDPTVIKNLFGPDYSAYDYYEKAEDSGYASLSSVSVKLIEPMPLEENERTEIFSLPFDDDPKKARDYFLEITQYQ